MSSTDSKHCWPIARSNLVDYTNSSSIHGVPYIGEKKRTFGERILWGVMFLIMLVACNKLIFDVYLKWTQNPVIVSFSNRPTSIWHIPFPAVTICPETKAESSKLNITKMYHRFAAGQKDFLYSRNETEISWMTAIAQVCDPSVFSQIDPKNLTDCAKCVDALRTVAIRKDNMIALSYYGRQKFHRDKLFDEIVTEEGICYTFNGIKVHKNNDAVTENWSLEKGYVTSLPETYPRRAIGVGSEYSLFLYLGLCTYDFDYICRKSAQGFKLLLHIPTEVPQISKHFYRIPFKQDVIVLIKPQMITTSESLRPYLPKSRQCYFEGERYLQYFQAYTQRNCELECFTNYTLLECGCTTFNMPRLDNRTKICGAGEIFCINEANGKFPNIKCDCLPSCSMITYDVEISQAESNLEKFYDSQKYRYLSAQDKYILYNCPLTQLTINFKEEHFISLVRSEFYGKTDFMSNCGGLLGLFLGISLMSLAEIVYFSSIRLLGTFHMHHLRMKPKLSPIVWVKPATVELKSDYI